MTAYVIIQVDVHDQAMFDDYKVQVPAIVAAFGGTYLARGGHFELLAGEWPVERTVVLSFPSIAAARAWHDSPEYAGPRAIRDKAASVNVFVIDGVDEP